MDGVVVTRCVQSLRFGGSASLLSSASSSWWGGASSRGRHWRRIRRSSRDGGWWRPSSRRWQGGWPIGCLLPPPPTRAASSPSPQSAPPRLLLPRRGSMTPGLKPRRGTEGSTTAALKPRRRTERHPHQRELLLSSPSSLLAFLLLTFFFSSRFSSPLTYLDLSLSADVTVCGEDVSKGDQGGAASLARPEDSAAPADSSTRVDAYGDLVVEVGHVNALGLLIWIVYRPRVYVSEWCGRVEQR